MELNPIVKSLLMAVDALKVDAVSTETYVNTAKVHLKDGTVIKIQVKRPVKGEAV